MLTLVTRAYPAYANYVVVIKSTAGEPARVYSSPNVMANGSLISSTGRVTVPASGALSVYLDDARTYTFTLVHPTTGQTIDVEQSVDPGIAYSAEGRKAWRKATGVAASTNNLTDTLLWSIQIPAGVTSPDSRLAIEAVFSCSANTNVKTHRISIGKDLATATTVFTRSRSNATHFGDAPILVFGMRGAVNSQVLMTAASGAYTSPMSSGVATYGIDFAVSQTVFFSGLVANAADFDRLDYASVEVWS